MKKTIFQIYDDIKKQKAENYNTGLVGEDLIVKSYKTLKISDLEKMRFIINKVINQKRENKEKNEPI